MRWVSWIAVLSGLLFLTAAVGGFVTGDEPLVKTFLWATAGVGMMAAAYLLHPKRGDGR